MLAMRMQATNKCTTTNRAENDRAAPCPKCGHDLSIISRHVGGKGACPHCLCESCGFQVRLVPIPPQAAGFARAGAVMAGILSEARRPSFPDSDS